MNNFNVMDVITTKNNTHVGVVDYSSTKHVIFFDFGINKSTDVITMIIIYRTYYSNIRFSIFVNMYFSGIQIGHPILINKRDIISGYDVGKVHRPKRKVLRKITVECDAC